MKVKLIKKGNYAKPPKLTSKLWAGSLDVQRLRKKIESLNPQNKEMQKEILRLFSDPRVRARAERNAKFWLLVPANFDQRASVAWDDYRLFKLGCQLLGKRMNWESEEHLLEKSSKLAEYSSDPERIFSSCFENVFDYIKHPFWEYLDTAKGTFLKEISLLQPADLKMADALYEFISSDPWNKLDSESKKGALTILLYFWKYGLKEQAKIYLETVSKIFKNEITVHLISFGPQDLLTAVISQYTKDVRKGKLHSLNDFQEIVRDLVLLSPDGVLENCSQIFGVRKDRFSLLCCELAKVNPDLVHQLAVQIYETPRFFQEVW